MDEIMDRIDPVMLERYAATARIYEKTPDRLTITTLEGKPLAECYENGWVALPSGTTPRDDDAVKTNDYETLEASLHVWYVLRLWGMRDEANLFADRLEHLLPDPPDVRSVVVAAIDRELDVMGFMDMLDAFDAAEAEGDDFILQADRIVAEHPTAPLLLAAFALDVELSALTAADALNDAAAAQRLYRQAIKHYMADGSNITVQRARLLAGRMDELAEYAAFGNDTTVMFRDAATLIRDVIR